MEWSVCKCIAREVLYIWCGADSLEAYSQRVGPYLTGLWHITEGSCDGNRTSATESTCVARMLQVWSMENEIWVYDTSPEIELVGVRSWIVIDDCQEACTRNEIIGIYKCYLVSYGTVSK